MARAWNSREGALATARAYFGGGAQVGDKLYALGGAATAGILASIEEYDPATSSWSTKTAMSTGKKLHSCAVDDDNGDIYLCGGNTGSTVATVYKYTPSTDTWDYTCSDMPAAREWGAACYDGNGHIFYFGGNDSSGVQQDDVYKYDIATDTWSTLTVTCPYVFDGTGGNGAVLLENGLIYVIPLRTTGPAYLNDIWAFDPVAETFDTTLTVGTFTDRVDSGIARSPDGHVMVIGGVLANGTTISGIAYEYNEVTDTWAQLAGMNTSRKASGAAVDSDGNLYCYGGVNAAGTTYVTTNVVEEMVRHPQWIADTNTLVTGRSSIVGVQDSNGYIYALCGVASTGLTNLCERRDPANGTWAAISAAPAARSAYAAAYDPVNDVIVVMGGYDGTVDVGTCWKYTISTDTWSTVSPLPSGAAVENALAVADGSGNIFLFGGRNGSTYSTTVYKYVVSTDTWSTVTALATARALTGGAMGPDGLIYIAGGVTTGGSTVSSVLTYDPVSDTYDTSLASLPRVMSQGAVAFDADGLLHYAGGSASSRHWVYNPATDAWDYSAAVLKTRSTAGLVKASDGTLILYAGLGPSSAREASVELLYPAGAGTGTGGFAFDGGATGSATRDGSTSGGYDFTGTATGASPRLGTTSGGFAFTGSAVGSAPALGTAAGGYAFAGSASGEAPPNVGASSGGYAFAGSAAGSVAHNAVATGTYDETGSSVGATPTWQPHNLQATAVSGSQIDLTWDALDYSTGYDIERDGVIVATDVATNSYSDMGLAAETLYTYRVRAVQA